MPQEEFSRQRLQHFPDSRLELVRRTWGPGTGLSDRTFREAAPIATETAELADGSLTAAGRCGEFDQSSIAGLTWLFRRNVQNNTGTRARRR
jgi:hypothetical protein